MDQQIFEKEVNFEKYCPLCQYGPKKETLDPCNNCLDYPMNENTEKPVRFKEKE